jgi:hypothetical protein
MCPLALLNVTSAKPNFTSWKYPCVSLRQDRVASSFGIKQIWYLGNTPRDNFMCLQSYIRNVNKHFWHRYQGGSQYSLPIHRLHKIVLASIISLTGLSIDMRLFMVFIGKCMTEFDLPPNYHPDPESLLCKSISSPGSSGSRIWEIVD